MRNVTSDFCFLLRQVTRRPLLYLLVIFILALGIGANTAMFTLVDAVLVRDLPAHEPERLVRIFSGRGDISAASYPDYVSLRENTEGISGAAAYDGRVRLDVSSEGALSSPVNGALASGSFFKVLGVRPHLGRLLSDDDDRGIGGQPVAALSHHYWRTRFNESPDIIGKTIRVNGHPITIVGVLPAGFNGIEVDSYRDIWLPLSAGPVILHWLTAESMQSEKMLWLNIVARLQDHVTIEELQAELDVHSQSEAKVLSEGAETHRIGPWRRAAPARTAAIEPNGSRELTRNAALLAGIVLLVLLLACANVAGLLSVRADEREREFAVRASLGASHRRLARMLLLETLLLAGAGAAAGVAMAHAVLHWITRQAPDGIMLPVDPATAVLDQRVLAATVLIAAFTTLLVGVAPALRVRRVDPASRLNGAGMASAGRERVVWRGGLVALQIGVSVLILVVAGLLLRSFWNTTRVDPGFEPRGAVMATLDQSRRGLSPEEQHALYTRVLQRVSALPGVTAAGLSRNVPLIGGSMNTTVEVDNPDAPKGFDARVEEYMVTPGFIEALGASIAAGRDLRAADMTTKAGGVLLVNETMAKTFWPGDDALGRRVLDVGMDGSRVVGVVADHKISSLREAAPPAIYVPFPIIAGGAGGALELLVRADRDAASLLPEIRGTIRALDPELPVLSERTLVDHLGNSYAEGRLFAWLLGAFAALALLLAAAGLYGMLGHVLRMRQREFGIRMAVGASTGDVASLVVRQVLVLVAAGLLTGLVATTFAGRLMRGLLFGVEASDPATLVGVGLLVLLVATMVSALPVRRAARVNPTEVLRDE
jgi:predicted permease